MNLNRSYILVIFLCPVLLSLLNVLLLFFVFSANSFFNKDKDYNRSAKSQKTILCKGRIFLVYRNKSRVFENRIVSLGAPNNVLSHASIPTIGVNSLANPAESLPSGLASVKGGFVYEIDDPNVRLRLYILGFLDTTLLPESQFRFLSQINPSLASNRVIINVFDGYGSPASPSFIRDKDDLRRSKSIQIGSHTIQSHMLRYFNFHGWKRGIVCK